MHSSHEVVSSSGLRLLVVAADFPNRIQPWLLNTTVHAIHAGADVYIGAQRRRGNTHQAVIDELNLLDRTIYVQPVGVGGVVRGVKHLASHARDVRDAAWRGLRISLRGPWLPVLELGKRIALAPVLGLPRIDVIHSHEMTLAFDFLRVARQHGAPLVHTFHGLPPPGVDGLSGPKMARLFADAAAFLVNTRFAKEQLAGLGCPETKIHVLPQGTDLREFPFCPSPPPHDEPVRFLSVGRLHEDKGHLFALRALSQLKRDGLQFTYRIVGVGPDRESLERDAEELGLTANVIFVGEVDDQGLRQEYRDAHVFLFPSLRDLKGKHEETQGVAMQEAQASGCIVVATRTGGIPESIDHRSAFLCADRDPDGLAAAIRQIVNSPERWDAWQRAGRAWIESNYDIEIIGERLMAIYRDVIDRHRGSS